MGEGEGGMIWEGSVEMCKLLYVKWIASPGLMHETGCSELGMGWPWGMDEEGGGRGILDGDHMCAYG